MRINIKPVYDAVLSALSALSEAATTRSENHTAQMLEHVETRSNINTKLDSLVTTSAGIDTTATAINQRIDSVHTDIDSSISSSTSSLMSAVSSSKDDIDSSISSSTSSLMSAVSNSHAALVTEINKNHQLILSNNLLLAIINNNQTQYVTYSGTVDFDLSANDANVYGYQNISIALPIIAYKTFIASVSVDFVMTNGELLPASDNVNAWLVDGGLNVGCRLAPQFGAYTKIIIKYGLVQSESV